MKSSKSYFDSSLYTICFCSNADQLKEHGNINIVIDKFSELKKLRDDKDPWLKNKVESTLKCLYNKCNKFYEFSEKVSTIYIIRSDGEIVDRYHRNPWSAIEDIDTHINFIITFVTLHIRQVISQDTDYLVHLLNKYTKEIIVFTDTDVPRL